jgi:hypothetical protein
MDYLRPLIALTSISTDPIETGRSNSHRRVAHISKNELEAIGEIFHGRVGLLHELVALSVQL